MDDYLARLSPLMANRRIMATIDAGEEPVS